MALPKFFSDERRAQKAKHSNSKRQELRVAQELNGRRQKGSGSKSFHKGDVKTMELLVESKRTEKDSMSVKKDWLIKIFREAAAYDRIPALSLEFDTMPDIVAKDWVAIPARTLAMLIDCYKMIEADNVQDATTEADPNG